MTSWEQAFTGWEAAAAGESLEILAGELEWLGETFPHLAAQAKDLKDQIGELLRGESR